MGGAAHLQQQGADTTGPYSRDDLLQPMEPRVGEFLCPHCKSPTFRRHSRAVTDHFRDILYACRNIACGATFKATLAIEYFLTPSGIPDPACTIPVRPLQRVAGVTIVEPAEPVQPDPNQFKLFE